MKTPDTHLYFELEPYYAHTHHTPRYRRSLPWEVSHLERDGSHLYVASGDRNYEASLFISHGKLTAVVNRVYVSRKDKLAFYGHDAPDYLDHLKRTVLHERLCALFKEYPRERIAELIHAALSMHSPFCPSRCPYPAAAKPRWDMSTEPVDRYTFGK